MILVREELLHSLRSQARRGLTPSQMLRGLISSLSPDTPDRQALIRYFTAAFCFKEGEAYPIFGWSPDGTAYLTDSALDYVLTTRIAQTQADWDEHSPESLRATNTA
jgi:hypothetical protein